MRIGDVGAVSQVGDLLSFSLAVVIVLTLIYSIAVPEGETVSDQGDYRASLFISVRDWSGFDPDHDGRLELDGIRERLSDTHDPLPVDGDVLILLHLDNGTSAFHFTDGIFRSEVRDISIENVLHGYTVLAESGGRVIFCLMEIVQWEVNE